MNIRSSGSRFLLVAVAASLFACASAACTVTHTGTGPVPGTDGGKSPDDDDSDDGEKPTTTKGGKTPDAGKPSTEEPSGTATCQAIFACALECTDTDCEDACYAEGSTAGKAQVDALIACSKDNACEDGDCIITNCSAEYEGCE